MPCCCATQCGRRRGQLNEGDGRGDGNDNDDGGDGDSIGGGGLGDRDGGDQPVSEREYSERPWGNYTVLDDDAADHKVKRLVVHPGKRLSYQRHSQRAEHWFIVSGTATVTLDGAVTKVHAGEAIDIPLESAHRIANEGDVDVVFIEVQRGSYFGEDDIVRLEDDYGRVEAAAPEAGKGAGGPGKVAPSA